MKFYQELLHSPVLGFLGMSVVYVYMTSCPVLNWETYFRLYSTSIRKEASSPNP
jgi:hypothetical protein